MIFLSSFPEKYVGKPFEIDCVDIEIHGFEDNQPPIFKGPGAIRGEEAGRLSYKVYNQISVNKDIVDYLKRVKEGDDQQKKIVRLVAKSYDGTEWSGAWSIPVVNLFQAPNILIHGEIDQLGTRIIKLDGDKKQDSTELVFANHLDLPFDGTVAVKSFHGEEVISTSYWSDHHIVGFEDTQIIFRESADRSRLHVEAHHGEQFAPPFIENWITEALVFATAKVVHPRMVIRHFEEDALVTIKATPRNVTSGMLPPFGSMQNTKDEFWKSFCAYLSKCKSMQQFELLDLTKGFYELCLASKGTLQGFLISLSIYIEFCVNQIFLTLESADIEEDAYKKSVKDLIQHVSTWDCDDAIRDRAKGLLSMLNKPSASKRMDILIEQGVITKMHKKIWNEARPYLAHGNVIDFGKQEDFWHYRNYLISMVYRLIFRIIGYKGIVLDYNGKTFGHVNYEWNDRTEVK